MGFVLLSVGNAEEDFCNCVVKHSKNELKVKIYGDAAKLNLLIEKYMIVELGYDKIISCEVMSYNNDEISEIKQLIDNDYISITGRIHNIIEIKEDFLLDIYIQTDVEFIYVLLSELNIELPQINSMIRIAVEGLKVFIRR